MIIMERKWVNFIIYIAIGVFSFAFCLFTDLHKEIPCFFIISAILGLGYLFYGFHNLMEEITPNQKYKPRRR